MGRYSNVNADECAVVVDQHTGRVRAQFSGVGAIGDAQHFLRSCQKPKGPGAEKVDFLSSASIVTGEKARKAMKEGRV